MQMNAGVGQVNKVYSTNVQIKFIRRLAMKKIRTISILSLCLAANLLVGAQFVPGELSLSQASETYGGGCCVDDGSKPCHVACSASGNHKTCKGASSGSDSCTTIGTGACGNCNMPHSVNLTGDCT